MTCFLLTEKRKRERKEGEGRKEEGKKGGRRERKEEGKKERRQQKECKCVFRHFQFYVVDYPLPPKSTNSDQGPGKNDTFLLREKRKKRKEGRREKREEGKKGGRRGRKKEGKKERRQKKECKCVFRHFQFCVVDSTPPLKSTNSDQGLGKK